MLCCVSRGRSIVCAPGQGFARDGIATPAQSVMARVFSKEKRHASLSAGEHRTGTTWEESHTTDGTTR